MAAVWTTQVTHTAVKSTPTVTRSATYTTAPGTLIYALGTVYETPAGAVLDPYSPTSRHEIGNFADERIARAACEAFCDGNSPAEIAELVKSRAIELAAMDGAVKENTAKDKPS